MLQMNSLKCGGERIGTIPMERMPQHLELGWLESTLIVDIRRIEPQIGPNLGMLMTRTR